MIYDHYKTNQHAHNIVANANRLYNTDGIPNRTTNEDDPSDNALSYGSWQLNINFTDAQSVLNRTSEVLYDNFHTEVIARYDAASALLAAYSRKRSAFIGQMQAQLAAKHHPRMAPAKLDTIRNSVNRTLAKTGELVAKLIATKDLSLIPEIRDTTNQSSRAATCIYSALSGDNLGKKILLAIHRDNCHERTSNTLPFHQEPWFKPVAGCHMSKTKPGMVAIYRSLDHFVADRQTIMKAGKFLAEFFPALTQP